MAFLRYLFREVKIWCAAGLGTVTDHSKNHDPNPTR